MTRLITKAELEQSAALARLSTPVANIRQDIEQRNFGLPVALHVTYFGLFLAYLAVMFVGFTSPEMILPMVIFVLFTAAFYFVPMLWAQMGPAGAAPAPRMDEFARDGIMTLTGRCSGRDAVVQTLILPALVLGWGVAIVTLAAFLL
ncbi:hypothetical protein EYB45_04395 [Erythrobacteraceae bacterium CFH 75059]|uniref:hypothetical protein n=1 Tax=Qipengyuania thermophila TaxID=2509361 RepID=UPI0010224941|nr:hypothetical protein [Qipengyuania thermophila]TCD04795.1 hypothetical protein EYB45_04395 [Erythrobacteraceae bacterium CFH 75059]